MPAVFARIVIIGPLLKEHSCELHHSYDCRFHSHGRCRHASRGATAAEPQNHQPPAVADRLPAVDVLALLRAMHDRSAEVRWRAEFRLGRLAAAAVPQLATR